MLLFPENILLLFLPPKILSNSTWYNFPSANIIGILLSVTITVCSAGVVVGKVGHVGGTKAGGVPLYNALVGIISVFRSIS